MVYYYFKYTARFHLVIFLKNFCIHVHKCEIGLKFPILSFVSGLFRPQKTKLGALYLSYPIVGILSRERDWWILWG